MSSKIIRSLLLSPVFLLIAIFASSAVSGLAGDWAPVNPEELAMGAPKIEPDADAEALYWEVYVANEEIQREYQTVLRHYIRIKIFTDRGRDQFSKVDIPYFKISGGGLDVGIRDIEARTTKPDGSSVILRREDIFERDISKGDGVKIKAKSFVVPAIETGAIIEYRWKEYRDRIGMYQRLDFSREIPVHLVKYNVKPVSHPTLSMRGIAFNGIITPWVNDNRTGFSSTTMSNVPGFKEEPQMPHENLVRPWVLIYYTDEDGKKPDKFWREYSKKTFDDYKDQIKATDEIRKVTAQLIGNESVPTKKIEAIFDFCRAKIVNIYDDASGLSPEEKEKFKPNKNAEEVLKRGKGGWLDINLLFAAMASAAGFEASIAKLPPRANANFNTKFADDYFLSRTAIAIKIDSKWKFFSPAYRYLPFGMLPSDEEDRPVLISDPKELIWGQTDFSAYEKTLEKRTGTFKLLEDGSLEGEGKIEFTGHFAAYYKEYNDGSSEIRRDERLKDYLRKQIHTSTEVISSSIENALDPDKPFIYTFKIRVPEYASRTGKRIIFQPSIFERGTKPLFNSGTRKNDLDMRYAWSEKDELTIFLPEGFSLESPSAPAVIEDKQKISKHQIKMSVSNDAKSLTFRRNFYFGNQGFLMFSANSYAPLKTLFDAFYESDSRSLSLKQNQ